MQRVTMFFFAIALACASLSARAGQEPPPLPNAEQLSGLLRAFDVPGVAMAAVDGCEVGGVVVAGKADLQTDAPVVAQTAFEAASLSKPVFAYLVLQLVDQGVIDLDRPFAANFDYPRIADKSAYALLTPRMVLTHRTGLPNWVDEGVAFHQRVTSIPFDSAPGEAYSYSGEAYQLLQAFVEREAGASLQQLFDDRLGSVMPDSTFVQPLPDGVVPSRGYARASEPAGGRGMDNLYPLAMAASSLVTTAVDYARFLSHVCRGQGLRAETLDEMLRPQSEIVGGDLPFPASYGLGWLVATLPEGTLAGHGGNNDEYRAFAGFFRESGDGVVILTNGASGEELIKAVLVPPADE